MNDRKLNREARRVRRLARQLWPNTAAEGDLKVRRGPYDWERGGDFHTDAHDPTLDWQRCAVCNDALRQAFVVMADLDLGPNGSGELVQRLHDIVADPFTDPPRGIARDWESS